jgi:hypothetical protein
LAFTFSDNILPDNILRFHHILIAEWIEQLLPQSPVSRESAVVTLAGQLGISRTRAFQFLSLLRIPAGLRRQIIGRPDLTEHLLRPFVQMDSLGMRLAVERLLGKRGMAKAG